MTQLNQLRTHQVENGMTSQMLLSSMRQHLDQQFDKMFNNISRMAPMFRKQVQGIIVGEGTAEIVGRSTKRCPARLLKLVRTLNILWHEWTLGLEGNLPAKDFNSSERGKVKFLYSRRMHVWRCISRHIHAGMTAEIAIDRIYQCFGHRLSVTGIIKAFQNSIKQHGPTGHPNLRV